MATLVTRNRSLYGTTHPACGMMTCCEDQNQFTLFVGRERGGALNEPYHWEDTWKGFCVYIWAPSSTNIVFNSYGGRLEM